MYAFFYAIDRILYPIRWIGRKLGRLMPGLGKIASASPALQSAIVLFLFMIVATTVAVVLQYRQDGWGDESETFKNLLVFLGCSIAMPFFLYFGIKLLMTPTVSAYPDIDDAWQEGLQTLQENGLGIKQLPLFLVLGGGSSTRLHSTFTSSGMPLLLDGVCKGAAPLRWFATEDAIYLCCHAVGVLPRLIELASYDRKLMAQPGAAAINPTATAAAFPDQSRAASATIEADFTPPSPPAGMPGRTIDLRDVLGDDAGSKQRSYQTTASRGVGPSAAEARTQRDRLAYVCKLLRAARDPVCPVNGMMLVTPFHTVVDAGLQTETAFKDDLSVVRESLQLRCPTVALVTDMQREPGFLELIRRVGGDLAASARFGRGFDHRTVPTVERLEALSQHACGAFEDWTYKLFAQPGALDKPSNGQLFATMCKVRGRFRKAFTPALANGFGCDRAEDGPDSLMFSGCYFAATGAEPGEQGFVGAVFDKLAQLEDDLEWMEGAIRVDRPGAAAWATWCFCWAWRRSSAPLRSSSTGISSAAIDRWLPGRKTA